MLRRITASLTLTALAASLLSGCIVAEAASPDDKNVPSTVGPAPVSTPTPEPSPSATPSPSPTATPEPVEEAPGTEIVAWSAVNGDWCSPTYCAQVIDFVMMDDYDDTTFWMEQTDARDGCLFGEAISDEYPGANVAYCPAGVSTPLDTLIEVSGDDPSQDRIWLYQGAGAETMFRG